MSNELEVCLIKIPVSSIATAQPFYRDVLGLTEEFAVAEYGWAQYKAGEMSIALYVPGMGGGTAAAGSSDHLHFSVSSFDAIAQRLADSGLDVEAALHHGNDGSQFYEITDPDGNRFKIMLAQE